MALIDVISSNLVEIDFKVIISCSTAADDDFIVDF